jgi:CHAT domain-containing protein/tetratricopeptide (TPR) repeat protein
MAGKQVRPQRRSAGWNARPQALEQRAEAEEAREALAAAHQTRAAILALRQRRHGEHDWRVTDARLALEHVELLMRLDAGDRRQLREASALESRVGQAMQQGRFSEALPLAQEVVTVRRTLLGPQHPVLATSLDTRGKLHQLLGDYPQALRDFEQAQEIRRTILTEDHPDFATSLDNLAGLDQVLNDSPRALSRAERAWDLRRRFLPADSPAYATALLKLARAYQAVGNYARAESLTSRALAIRRRALTEAHPDYIQTLHSLATLAQAQRHHPQALALYERTRDLLRKYLPENHLVYAVCVNNLAEVHKQLGETAKARPLLEEACALQKRYLPKNHLGNAVGLYNLGRLYRDLRQYRDAAHAFEESLAIRQEILNRTLPVLNERQRLAYLDQLKMALHSYLSVAGAADFPAHRIYDAVLAWKGVLATREAEERLGRDQPELQPRLTQLRRVRTALARLTYAPSPRQAERPGSFEELEAEKEALELSLARSSGAFRWLQEVRRSGTEQVTAALPAGTALVDFLDYQHTPPASAGRSESRLCAFVLVPRRPVTLVPLGSTQTIARVIRHWRQRAGTTGSPDQGADLARLLWQPLRPHLEGVRTVLIAPDGPLYAMPFAGLPGSRPGTYLVEEIAVNYVTSGHHCVALHHRPNAPRAHGLLAVGGLDYGHLEPAEPGEDSPPFRRSRWAALPGARLEVERIARAFRDAFPQEPSPCLLTGSDTNADVLKRRLQPEPPASRWRYVHVATHAFFETPLPSPAPGDDRAGKRLPNVGDRDRMIARHPLLSSGLVLAGANQSPADGVLTAEEVASLDLRGTELVVLSACETGLGVVAAGEGVFGLQRSFQTAGAATLVTSLWNVQDAAAGLVMEEFYNNLWGKSLTRSEALRQAQITVLRHPERVRQRARELRETLTRRGIPEEALARRGILPDAGAGAEAHGSPVSPPAWWAAFVLCGDWR